MLVGMLHCGTAVEMAKNKLAFYLRIFLYCFLKRGLDGLSSCDEQANAIS